MSEQDFKITYTNFNPNRDEALKIRAMASDIYYMAPSDSTLKISLEKFHKTYQCRIEVKSSSFAERAFAKGNELFSALTEGHSQINDKITQWKRQRFNNLVAG